MRSRSTRGTKGFRGRLLVCSRCSSMDTGLNISRWDSRMPDGNSPLRLLFLFVCLIVKSTRLLLPGTNSRQKCVSFLSTVSCFQFFLNSSCNFSVIIYNTKSYSILKTQVRRRSGKTWNEGKSQGTIWSRKVRYFEKKILRKSGNLCKRDFK